MFIISLSYQLCLLWLYVTVKLMFIAYLGLLGVTMMVISVCVNECTFYICYYLKAALVHCVTVSHLVVISALQRYKTDFSTSIGWCVNIIRVN